MNRFVAIVLLLTVARPARADQPPRLPAATIQAIETAVADTMQRSGAPGISVALVVQGELKWSRGFGLSDIENNVPARAETVYRLASVSKTITAVAAMQLAESGQLDLDAPIQKYVPSFPEKPWPITARQLLCHQSGVRHYSRDGRLVTDEIGLTKRFESLQAGLALFKDDALLHEPGTKFSYTTHGYTLLGCAIEGASGRKFMDYVRDRIAKPAGMDRLRDDDARAIIPNRAQGYRKSPDGQLRNSELADTSYKIPGGGLCSTVEDLAKFAIALQADRLMKRETRDRMWTRVKTRDGEETTYGLGWSVGKRDGRRVASHSGAQPRVATYLLIAPDDGFAVALMSNLEGTPLSDLAGRILTTVVK